MNTALLLIDLQNDYFPGGKNPLEGSPEAAGQARRLLEAFRNHGLPLVHIQHVALSPTAPSSCRIPGRADPSRGPAAGG